MSKDRQANKPKPDETLLLAAAIIAALWVVVSLVEGRALNPLEIAEMLSQGLMAVVVNN